MPTGGVSAAASVVSVALRLAEIVSTVSPTRAYFLSVISRMSLCTSEPGSVDVGLAEVGEAVATADIAGRTRTAASAVIRRLGFTCFSLQLVTGRGYGAPPASRT